jgi:hypothetical protein
MCHARHTVTDCGEPSQPTPAGVVLVDESCGLVRLDVVIVAPTTGRSRCIDLSMTWRPEDALSVSLQVSARPDHPALPRGQWVVLRDFLRYGLEQPTGDGDVRLYPDRTNHPSTTVAADGVFEIPVIVRIELARPGRPYVLAVPGALLADFVAETERRVPTGEERSDELLEEFIARLLQS